MNEKTSETSKEGQAPHGFPAPLYDFFFKNRGDRALVLYFRRNGASVEDSDDLLQDTILKTVRHFDQFDGRASLKSWIWAIARNQLLDSLRRRSRHYEESIDPSEITGLLDGLYFEQSEEQRALGREQQDMIQRAYREFEAKNPEAASVFHMFLVEGMPIAEVASVLGRSTQATRKYISFIRAKLVKHLREAVDVR